jgi:PAB-dependent poly(A)-specific ribonuclease subunit 2
MKDLRCMSFTTKDAKEILVAGLQDVMFTINVDKGEITKSVRAVFKMGLLYSLRIDSYD